MLVCFFSGDQALLKPFLNEALTALRISRSDGGAALHGGDETSANTQVRNGTQPTTFTSLVQMNLPD